MQFRIEGSENGSCSVPFKGLRFQLLLFGFWFRDSEVEVFRLSGLGILGLDVYCIRPCTAGAADGTVFIALLPETPMSLNQGIFLKHTRIPNMI